MNATTTIDCPICQTPAQLVTLPGAETLFVACPECVSLVEVADEPAAPVQARAA